MLSARPPALRRAGVEFSAFISRPSIRETAGLIRTSRPGGGPKPDSARSAAPTDGRRTAGHKARARDAAAPAGRRAPRPLDLYKRVGGWQTPFPPESPPRPA